MRKIIALAFAVLPASALAQADSETIIVTARSLDDTAKSLAECLARNCPPDEDIKATLTHAENQFVAGDYKSARQTLLKSVGRNKDEAKAYPLPVSDLHRANARVAVHLGERSSYSSATLDSRAALKEGLPADDWRILASTLEVADMRARLGYTDEALRIFADVRDKAQAKGWNSLVWTADVRTALILLGSDSSGLKARGRATLEALAKTEGENARSLRLAAKVLLARNARKAGSDAETEALITEYAAQGGAAKPTLVFAEPIKQPGAVESDARSNSLAKMAMDSYDDRWADVGFWVQPDGRVNEVEILRSSGKGDDWMKPVVKSLQSRRYAPLKVEPGDPGFYIVERYTLTAFWEDRLGTRIRQRARAPRIERIDLSTEPAAISAR